MSQATAPRVARPLPEGSERRIKNRRGSSFNQSEIAVVTALLAGAENDPAWSGEREAKTLASLRSKFRKMHASFGGELASTIGGV
jgi:hypothetical protein